MHETYADTAAPRAPTAASNPPAIGYLTNRYPSASHTFIRRELLALERAGWSIRRFSVRDGGPLVDDADRTEAARTVTLLGIPRLQALRRILRGLGLAGPRRVLRALLMTLRLGAASDRGRLVHGVYLLEALLLLDLAHAEGLRHLHVHFGTNPATVALLTRLLGGPSFSMTVHGPEEFDTAIGWSLGTKLRNATFTAAISSFGAAQLRRWVEPEHWERIHVVHCTVDEDWFAPPLPVAEDADTYLCVGRLSAQKGQLLLLDALRDAVDGGFRGRLVLVGDGELRGLIEERIRTLRLEDRVTLTGALDGSSIRARMDQARGLVLPSFAEGLPVVLMEAMSRARPVLTTTIMGIPELVRHGEEGWLVCAGDRPALARALLEMDAASAAQLTELGRRGRERVRERHAVDAVLPGLEALLREAVTRAEGPVRTAPSPR